MLNGGGAYHAAVHCAAVAAAQRQTPPAGQPGHKTKRARRNGFFVRAARAVTRSLRGSGAAGGGDVAMADSDLASEFGSGDGDSPSLAPAGPGGAEAGSHLPPTEAHVALVHPAMDSPMAPPVPSSPAAGTIRTDASAEPAAVQAQPLSPKAGLLPVSVLAPSLAAPVS